MIRMVDRGGDGQVSWEEVRTEGLIILPVYLHTSLSISLYLSQTIFLSLLLSISLSLSLSLTHSPSHSLLPTPHTTQHISSTLW